METILNFFFNEGILGVLVAGNILVIVFLFLRYEKSKEELVKTIKEHTKTVCTLQDEKIQLQEQHMKTLMEIQAEVNQVTTKLTNTMEALIIALTKGAE